MNSRRLIFKHLNDRKDIRAPYQFSTVFDFSVNAGAETGVQHRLSPPVCEISSSPLQVGGTGVGNYGEVTLFSDVPTPLFGTARKCRKGDM
jgi:hypothetical protein